MQLQSMPPLVFPNPPQLSSHPQPQFVAAKSLMNKSSKNFDYTYILCEQRKMVQRNQKKFRKELK